MAKKFRELLDAMPAARRERVEARSQEMLASLQTEYLDKIRLEYRGYVGNVEFDEDEQLYRGRVQNVSAVIEYAASHIQCTQREFERSIQTYLAVCRERGLQPESAVGELEKEE